MAKEHIFDAGEVFSGKASGTKIRGFKEPSHNTPAVDDSFIFGELAKDLVVFFLQDEPDPLYIFGDTGTGKSSLVRQVAARLNYPVWETTGSERLEVSDLIGHLTLRGGEMSFVDGPLVAAMKAGGVFILNEIDAANPAVLILLNTLFDKQPLLIPETNELVTPEDTFRFVATANTAGSGDDSGRFTGTNQLNQAFMDRFTILKAEYPAPADEKALLAAKFPSLPELIRDGMVDIANKVRGVFSGGRQIGFGSAGVDVVISTRTLLRWAELSLCYQGLASSGISPVLYALDRAVGFRAGREGHAMLLELCQRVFGTSADSSNMKSVV
ncbi:AAA family ATPase [Mailhella sp.]